MVPRSGGFLDTLADSEELLNWLTDADVDFSVQEFVRTRFRGGLNWYRNIDRNWELSAPFSGVQVSVPALYVAGDRDLVVGFRGMDIANLEHFAPQLRGKIILPGCEDWTRQERPKKVNEVMIEFLRQFTHVASLAPNESRWYRYVGMAAGIRQPEPGEDPPMLGRSWGVIGRRSRLVFLAEPLVRDRVAVLHKNVLRTSGRVAASSLPALQAGRLVAFEVRIEPAEE